MLRELANGLARGEELFTLVVETFVAVAADTALLAVEFLAAIERGRHISDHVAGVALLAARFHIFFVEKRPEPVFVATVALHDAGSGAAIAAVAGRAAEAVRIVDLQQFRRGMGGERHS